MMRLVYIKYLNIKRVIILLVLPMVFSSSGFTQPTNLRIIDLSVRSTALYPIQGLNDLNEQTRADTLIITFKMNKAELASNVVVHIGNKKGRKNILNTAYPVIQDGNKYYVNTGQNRFEIRGYTTYFEIPVNRPDVKDFFYIKIYAEDKVGAQTTELDYKI